jgi:hypothetical protein
MTLHLLLSFGPGEVRYQRVKLEWKDNEPLERAVRRALVGIARHEPMMLNVEWTRGIPFLLRPLEGKRHPWGVGWLDRQGTLPFQEAPPPVVGSAQRGESRGGSGGSPGPETFIPTPVKCCLCGDEKIGPWGYIESPAGNAWLCESCLRKTVVP